MIRSSQWVVVLGIWLSMEGVGVRMDTPLGDFSPAVLQKWVEKQVASGPRIPGSGGHKKVQRWILEQLKEQADIVYTIPAVFKSPVDGKEYSLVNILGRFRKDARVRVVIGTHYDTRPWADYDLNPRWRGKPVPGANDGASGVAVLLALAHRLKHSSQVSIGVDLAFFDGEELGSYENADTFSAGSKAFAQWVKDGNLHLPHPQKGIIIDMVGDKEWSFYPEPYSRASAPALIEEIWALARELNIPGFLPSNPDMPGITDDHVSLIRLGIPTILLLDDEYPYWHTTADTTDKISGKSLALMARLLYTWLKNQNPELEVSNPVP